MTFWRTICYCHSRFADRELLFINLDETSVGHTMTPPIGCVAKPRTAGGKQPHAQVLKQHVGGAWTYVSVICNCKHIQGIIFSLAPRWNSRRSSCAPSALCHKLVCVFCGNSPLGPLLPTLPKFSKRSQKCWKVFRQNKALYSLIVRRHTCHGRSWQWHASASCSLYISQRRQRITYSRLICKASPLLSNIWKGSTRSCAHIQSMV